MNKPLRLLIAESETPMARQNRRDSTGRTSGETFAATLIGIQPGCDVEFTRPIEAGTSEWSSHSLAGYGGIFLSGSPMHAWENTPEVQRHMRFMQAAFASATPCFGSCAGLQIAVTVAGGTVRAKSERHEAGLARRIWATDAGRDHPLLDGRPASWDALCVHSDEVEQFPATAILLASNASTLVQAAEVRFGAGIFWGVQYHPELPPGEIADALRRQSDGLISQRLARTADDVETTARLLEELNDEPSRTDLLWRPGTNEQVADSVCRTLELRNFINYLVLPGREIRRAERARSREAGTLIE